ncbi:MAG: peptidoglycan DD-metalloendopeptidase family protein [Lachnospiraceae bacterium]|nr:peptidoglycan DD-metalloendopeptidase family protein [Lachnospiraceae bacterium]
MISKRRTILNYVLIISLALGSAGYPSVVSYATGDDAGANAPAATEAPATEAPTTQAPATEAPTTQAPATEAPATEKSTKKKKDNKKKTTEATTQQATTQQVIFDGPSDASVIQARQDAKVAEEGLKKAQSILKNLKSAKYDLEMYVLELDKVLNELQIETTHLEKNQRELEASIEETKHQLADAKAAQESQYEQMKNRIQMVYESGNKSYLDVLLTATSMTDMLNKTEYVSCVSLYDYNILKQLKKAKEKVANIKMKLDKDLESNKKLQADVKEQQAAIDKIEKEKKAQIEEYNTSIAGQEQEVQKYMNAKAEAESIIIAAEQAALAAANAANTTVNVPTEYNGGVFVWPAPGNNKITSYFGGRTSPVAGASSNHMGIDIAVSTGDPIVAAASGTVIVATYNYAEGNYVCIDHGGGVVTLYMHNSSLLVSVGQSVSAGQTIANAGSTGISTGPHCHFGVRVNGNYVDPLTYLQ